MAAKDTFSTQTLITKTPANGHAVSSGGQTGFGAQARARHPSREEGKDKKKICLLCRPGLTQGWLGWAIFSRVFRLSQKAAKKGKHFLQGPPPFPLPNLSTTRPSCAQHWATAYLFRLLGTNIQFKDGATEDDGGPFQDVFVFDVSRYPAAGKCFQKTRYPAVRNFDQFSRNSSLIPLRT